MELKLCIANSIYQCTASIDNCTAIVPISINDRQTIIHVPVPRLKEGCTLSVNGITIFIQEENKGLDDLYNYVHNFLQWYFVILQSQDAIHEGDVTRTNIILKHMIPFFFSHSVLSKYFTECIDYILTTEFILPPHVAAEVRTASFVNVHGGFGKNKAADLHKENEVKLLKDLIQGLGANKTENSIIAISKAAPVISDVSTNFDKMLKLNDFTTKHKKHSTIEDIEAIINSIKTLDIWKYNGNRVLTAFHGISQSPFHFEAEALNRSIKSTVFQLQRDLPCEAEEVEDENEEEA